MRVPIAVWLAVSVSVAGAGCAAGYGERDDSSVAAIVNGKVIFRDDLAARTLAGMNPQAVLDTLVDEELVVQAALAAHVEVSGAEVDAALAEIQRQNRLSDAELVRALAAHAYTLASYRHDLERQLIRLRAVNVIVAPRVAATDSHARRTELDAKTRAWISELRANAEITMK